MREKYDGVQNDQIHVWQLSEEIIEEGIGKLYENFFKFRSVSKKKLYGIINHKKYPSKSAAIFRKKRKTHSLPARPSSRDLPP